MRARSARRREVPDSAKRQTARNARQRETPDSAKRQTARSARQREAPDSAKRQTSSANGRLLSAVWRLALFGVSRSSAFRALRRFAPYGSSRLSDFIPACSFTYFAAASCVANHAPPF